MDFFKGIAASVGWLTTYLGGIGAILYGCGYLITQAQSNLLGIDVIVGFNQEQFVQEGAKFFLSLGIERGMLADAFLNLFLMAGLFAVLIFLPTLLVCLIKKMNIRDFLAQQQERYTRYSERKVWWWRIAAYLALVSLLLFLVEDPQRFNDPLEVSNLLYANREISKNPSVEPTRTLLVNGDTGALRHYFEGAMLMWLKSVVLLLLVWRIASPWRHRLLAVSPFVIIVGINTVLMPMLYGVLQKQIRFPVIALRPSNVSPINTSGKFFLLNKTDAEFVIWDTVGQKILWMPISGIESAEISQVEHLFKSNTRTPHRAAGDAHDGY